MAWGAGEMPFWGGAIGGVPPFMVMQEILGGDIKFDGTAWEGMSGDAIDFVDRLLDRDFNNRMTAEQVRAGPDHCCLLPHFCGPVCNSADRLVSKARLCNDRFSNYVCQHPTKCSLPAHSPSGDHYLCTARYDEHHV